MILTLEELEIISNWIRFVLDCDGPFEDEELELSTKIELALTSKSGELSNAS